MTERDKLKFDHDPPSPSQEGSLCGGSMVAGMTGDQPRVGSFAVRGLSLARVGRFATRIAGISLLSLLVAFVTIAAPATSSAEFSIGVSVTYGPPALPIYVQPPCPGPNYIWTPGYWAWSPGYGYYWVPGTWVMAPFPGALWTPGYWDWDDGVYVWSAGYWGPVVGFYGGIDYGYGYTGYGYQGGYWRSGTFYYNRAVNNIRTTTITNVYDKRVKNNLNVTRVSYHGGPGGTGLRPTRTQLVAARQRREGPVGQQQRQREIARGRPEQLASVNHGRPDIAATRTPGAFNSRDVVHARRAGAPHKAQPKRSTGSRGSARAPHGAEPGGNPPEAAHRIGPAAHAPRHVPARGQTTRRDNGQSPTPHAASPSANAHRPQTEHQRSPRAQSHQQSRPHPPERRQNAEKHESHGPHGHG